MAQPAALAPSRCGSPSARRALLVVRRAAAQSSATVELLVCDTVAAERELRTALGLATEMGLAPREMPNLRGELLVNLAEILVLTGEPDQAVPVLGEAVELYDDKGDIVSAARARALASCAVLAPPQSGP